MAVCGGVEASALPAELIVHIFSFLSDADRLRASAVCARWRECLFFPALWNGLRLRARTSGNGGASARLEFLTRRFGGFARELQLELCGGDAEHDRAECGKLQASTHLEQLLRVLRHLRYNRNLQRLSLYGDVYILQDDSILDSSYLSQIDQGGKRIKEIQQLFEEILSNSRQLKWLSCSFVLGLLTPVSLASLSNPSTETLEHLSLLDSQLQSLVPAAELQRLPHLRSLSIDFCHFSSDMCRLLSAADRTPLHRLSLLLNGAALEAKPLHDTATEDDLKALVRSSANLRVYLMAVDVCSEDLLQVLKPSLPLERVHLDSFSSLVTDSVLELISQQYHRTLTHFVLVRDEGGFPDLSLNRNEDPLVLLAWRCVHLAVLIIHGYTVWSHNLVAISRLRGSNLKVLTVTEDSIDFDPDQCAFVEGDPVHNLVKEVSLGLGRVWHPCLDSSVILSDPTQHFHREMLSFSEGV
ncbi:F-box only protein 33 [Hoplias malabaricus]|uniref:F-box only protein 33 n=1 Tax=Hoplias malabaricus TaxID=27720 RepID=UPI00346312DA